jgi:hypothetical protein
MMSGSRAKSFGSWASRSGGPEPFDPAAVAGCSSLKFLMIREKKMLCGSARHGAI